MIKFINKYASWLLLLGIILELVVFGMAWQESSGEIARFFQASARLSGRVSFFFFAILMMYATQVPDFNREDSAYRVKYLLFRDFAIIHLIHWCLLAASVSMNNFELLPVRVIGGAIAYGIIVMMPVLMRRATTDIRVLTGMQAFYMFWVWLVFMMTYTKRLSGETQGTSGTAGVWWVMFIALIVLIFWRSAYLLLANLEKRQKRIGKF